MENIKLKNFCYKAIMCKAGVILLFESFKDFKEKEIRINYAQGDIYIELGNNVLLMTKNIINHLSQSPVVFICKGKFDSYEVFDVVKELEVNTETLSQIKGALSVISNQTNA